MIIKLPPMFDVARYEIIPDWGEVDPRPAIVAAKATEGTTYKDPTFLDNWHDLLSENIPRIAYHFNRKAYNPNTQAQFFLDYVASGGIRDSDFFCLDVEEGGESAAQLRAWFEYVMQRYPRNRNIIYSRKNLLDPISFLLGLMGIQPKPQHPLNAIEMTLSDREFFRKIPVWTAGYPLNPDLYNSIPSWYIPDQTKWGPAILWQYSDQGVVYGIIGKVDLDFITPEFLATITTTPPPEPPADVVTTPHPGIQRTTGERNNWPFVYDVVAPERVTFDTVYLPPSQLSSVPLIATSKQAHIGSNCGEWNDRYKDQPYYLQPINYTVDDGMVIIPRTSAQPSLMITADNKILLDHKPPTVPIKHAFTGLRYLVENSVINPLLDGTEGHSRKVFGINAVGQLLMLSCEGVYPNQGWTLPQCAQWMLQHGAVKAADFGGGGDATCWADGELLLVPENKLPDGTNFARYLPQVLLITAKENGGSMINGLAKEALGNIPVVRKTPSRYGVEVTRLAAYAEVEFTENVPVVSEGPNDRVGEMWIKRAVDGNYVNQKLYVNNILKDVFTILREPSTEPPTTAAPASIDMTLTAGSVVTVKDASGNVLWTGTA